MSNLFYTPGAGAGTLADMNHATSTSHPTRTAPTQAQPAPRAGDPPGPRAGWFGLPLLRAMRRDYLGFVTGLQRDHGDLSLMHIANERAYDLNSPELVREALVDQAEHLVRWERGVAVFEQVFGRSVLVTEGATWQRQRRLLMPAFTPKRVAGYARLMTEAAAQGLDQALPAGQQQGTVAMDALFSQLTMDVIMRTLFSHAATPEEVHSASGATQTLSETAMREMFYPLTLPDWLPLPGKAAKRQALHRLRSLIGRHIEARRQAPAAPEREDLLARLLAARDESDGAALSPREVFDQCMVSFQAGHETSATALLWWSLLLARHPELAQRLHAEVDQVLGTREPTADDVPQLVWLNASLKEALRLYPPVGALMSRRTTANITLGGWQIPRGALLRISPWVLHRDPRWFSEPEAFRPERFLPDAPPLPRSAWMPFGVGPRVCLGQHFALMEMGLVAAMLLQRYTLALGQPEPQGLPDMNVTLRPRGGVRLRLQRRQGGAGGRVGSSDPAAISACA
ncbi:cytochrome P450 [Curvibacter sp. HBC28]|uniref:Cytochrome P450 n=1 Tax=Curvibacter microcysteis TaxID=3026419 RepID=A0ABT5MHH3_9BURK|nr:cytochrome P450 [Curvibacter sp. HBC28]MDD0816035.1 cytochrome P450 [Curvibacter sp. HBC28]